MTELANEGSDTVRTGLDGYRLGAGLEHLVMLGAADLSGIGNDADNQLVGNGGRNRLEGGAGRDLLDGRWGADLMVGGTDDDTYRVDDAGDRVQEQAGEGTDTVLASVSAALADHVEHLVLLGDVAIDGTGNALDNHLTGNAAANRLDGGAGADVMAGGAGDDTYLVDQAGDVVVERAGEGRDTVISRIDLLLGDAVEDGQLADADADGQAALADLNITGNALDNHLAGNAGANRLDGGTGADVMRGGAGNDSYWVDQAGDRISELAGGGHDTAWSSVGLVLSEQVEDGFLTGTAAVNITGNALNNHLAGNAAANRLDGGAGADVMAGGAGDDSYWVDQAGDGVVEAWGAGVDTVYSQISYVLPEHVERLTLQGSAALSASGNALDNTLTGNSGHNLLSGGAGNDRLIGLAGDDTYLYQRGDGLDRIEEQAGTDTLRLGQGLTAQNLALRVVGTGAVRTATLRLLDADGQEQSDQGVDFAVTVDARGQIASPIERFELADGSVLGFDALRTRSVHTDIGRSSSSLVTGRHDDWVHGDSRAQSLRTSSGHDIVFVFGGADTLYGEGGNDALFGGAQNDRLEGGVGNDFLAGEQHDDLILAGAGANLIGFNRGDGKDTVQSVAGAWNTLSLGGGLELDDLALRRSGQDLVVLAGDHDQITLQGWYAGIAQRTVQRLQIIETIGDDGCHEPAGSGWRIGNYDFSALVREFDAAPLTTLRHGQVSPWRMAQADGVEQEQAQIRRTGHERQAALAQLQRLQAALPSLERGVGAFASLGQEGFFSPVAVDEKQRELSDKQHELQAQQSTLAGLEAAHEAARRRLAQLESAYQADLQQERVDASAQAAQARAERDKLRHRMNLLELRAPQPGVIKDLATRTVGSVVAPGQVLMSLVPDIDPLQAEVWVRNEDIGFVHPGQAVQIKLAAYPFQKYGLLAGEVIHLGPDAADAPVAPVEGGGAAASALPRYRALVRLSAQRRAPTMDAMPLTAGMQVTADILLGERSVLSYLLSPLQRAWHDAARER